LRAKPETLRADVLRAYPRLASAPRLRVTPFADVLVGHARRPLWAMLLVKSLWRITAYPAGFDPEHVLTLKVQMSGQAYRTPERKRAYLAEVLQQASAVPGVLATGVSSDADSRLFLVRQDGPPMPILDRPIVRLNVTSAGYAATVGMRIVEGRWMTDDEPSPVYVINEALARGE